MRFLIFGDIFGRPGREALREILPKWRKDFSPDVVAANGENLSHGKGINPDAVREMIDAGVDVLTGGNHILEGRDAELLLNDPSLPIIRPINFIKGLPGKGSLIKEVNGIPVLFLNAIGQAHMRATYNSPYEAIEAALDSAKEAKISLLDWHAETTSEKRAVGWWLDGRVSVVYGTHTHIPTADEQILPQGTAFISDVGMTGPHYSAIGEDIERRVAISIRQQTLRPEVAEAPPYEANALLADIDDSTGRAISIRRLREIFPAAG